MLSHSKRLLVPLLLSLVACSGASDNSGQDSANVNGSSAPTFEQCLASLPAKPIEVSAFVMQFDDPTYDTFVTGADGTLRDLGSDRLVAPAGGAVTLRYFRFFHFNEDKLPDGLAVSAVLVQDGKEVFRQAFPTVGSTSVGVDATLSTTLPDGLSGRVELRFEEQLPGKAASVVSDFDGNEPQPVLVSSQGKPIFLEIAGKATTTLCLDANFKNVASGPLTPGGTLVFAYDPRRLLSQLGNKASSGVEPRIHVRFFDGNGNVTSPLVPNGGGEQDASIGVASPDKTQLFLIPVPVPTDARSARVFIQSGSASGTVFDSDFGKGWLVQ
jgi:hypothetical protein